MEGVQWRQQADEDAIEMGSPSSSSSLRHQLTCDASYLMMKKASRVERILRNERNLHVQNLLFQLTNLCISISDVISEIYILSLLGLVGFFSLFLHRYLLIDGFLELFIFSLLIIHDLLSIFCIILKCFDVDFEVLVLLLLIIHDLHVPFCIILESSDEGI